MAGRWSEVEKKWRESFSRKGGKNEGVKRNNASFKKHGNKDIWSLIDGCMGGWFLAKSPPFCGCLGATLRSLVADILATPIVVLLA